MERIGFYSSLGYVLELLAVSDYHRKFFIKKYLWTEMMPPLCCGQVKIYKDSNGVPLALVTWAWLSSEVENEIHSTGRALNNDEWQSGDKLFFNDFIAPYGHAKKVIIDLTHNEFSDKVASSIDRHPDGSIRKINRWTGVEIRNNFR